MKFKARYVLLNQSEVTLMRRFMFFWFKYEPFKNKLRKKQERMNQLRHEFESVYSDYRQLLAEQSTIVKDIESARGEEKNYGRIFEAKLSLFPFRKDELPEPSQDYRLFAKALKGGVSIAESVAGKGTLADTADVGGIPVNATYYGVGGERFSVEAETVGSTSLAVRPNRNKQQQNQKGNNNQQNNQRNS